MSAFTLADLKLGGRLSAACEALGANRLRVAAGIFLEIGNDLNVEAEAKTGLLAPDDDDWTVPAQPTAPELITHARNLEACGRGVHAYAAPDYRGWRTCAACGFVNISPPGGGPMDMGTRR